MPKIDNEFIRGLEGFTTDAFVPSDRSGSPLGKSGSTIGTGIDLAHQSATGLRAAGVDEQTITMLQPFFGVRGKKAQELLKLNPLKLEEIQLKQLDDAVMNRDSRSLAKKFNAVSPRKFEDLPPAFQTVLTSVNHQFGTKALTDMNFWGQMTGGQFNRALENLRDFGDNYPTRRNKEADLFERGIIEEFLRGQ